MQLVDHAHVAHLAKRREAHAVEPVIIAEVHEELGGAGIWAGGREAHHAPGIALHHLIVLDAGAPPDRGHLRGAVDAQLRHEAADHPKEGHVVIKADLDQVVDAVGALGSPASVDIDDDVALRRLQLHRELGRGGLCGFAGGQQGLGGRLGGRSGLLAGCARGRALLARGLGRARGGAIWALFLALAGEEPEAECARVEDRPVHRLGAQRSPSPSRSPVSDGLRLLRAEHFF